MGDFLEIEFTGTVKTWATRKYRDESSPGLQPVILGVDPDPKIEVGNAKRARHRVQDVTGAIVVHAPEDDIALGQNAKAAWGGDSLLYPVDSDVRGYPLQHSFGYDALRHSCMDHHVQRGFVLEDGLNFRFLPGLITLEGRITCKGGIEVTVLKEITILEGEGPRALVRTSKYSYHANLRGGANIFRYDSPGSHRDCHHRHIFDTFGDNAEIDVIRLGSEDEIPTISDVLTKLQVWFEEHEDKLPKP